MWRLWKAANNGANSNIRILTVGQRSGARTVQLRSASSRATAENCTGRAAKIIDYSLHFTWSLAFLWKVGKIMLRFIFRECLGANSNSNFQPWREGRCWRVMQRSWSLGVPVSASTVFSWLLILPFGLVFERIPTMIHRMFPDFHLRFSADYGNSNASCEYDSFKILSRWLMKAIE